MSQLIHVACPHCHSINRVPKDKLSQGGKCGKCRQPLFAKQPVELDDKGFSAHVMRSELPVLVDFWASWCGPCQMMAPVFAQAAGELEPRLRFAKLNTEKYQTLSANYGVRSIPTLILFRAGQEVARISGALNATQLHQWINQNLK